MSIEFLLTALILVLTPGTGMIYTLICALSQGRRGAILGAIGSTLSILPHIIAAILGLAAVLHASAVAFQVLKWAGVAYLLYLGWKTVSDKSLFNLEAGPEIQHGSKIVWRGILASLLNPKLSVFFLALLPPFISTTSTSPMFDMALLGGVFMAMTFVAFAIIGMFAATLRQGVQRRPRLLVGIRRSFGGLFLLLGLRLAFIQRN